MDVTPLIPENSQIIEAYGEGGFRITQKRYNGSVMVFPGETRPWEITDFSDCTLATLEPILQAEDPQPEIVLIGCGGQFQMVPRDIREAFKAKGISVEAMDTGAACRTYNILMTEGRKVVAALIAT